MTISIVKSELFGSVKCDFWRNENGEVFMTSKQLGEAIGYSDPQKGIDNLISRNQELRNPDFSDTLNLRGTDGKFYSTRIFSEDGIFEASMLAKTEKAFEFRSWVRGVIKTIRKTGGYVADEDLFIQTYLPHIDEATQAVFRTTLVVIRKQNEQIAVMVPKANYFDALVDRNLLTNFRDTSKELGVGQKVFIDWLLAQKYVYRDTKKQLKPYSQYIPDLFELKEWTRGEKADVQTLITPKGRETFRLLLEKVPV